MTFDEKIKNLTAKIDKENQDAKEEIRAALVVYRKLFKSLWNKVFK